MDRIDFESNAKNWLDSLRKCEFAGEIDVSEETLEVVAPFISRGFESNAPSDMEHAARVVFAVNCAYYADEGFWVYFCQLIRRGNDPATQTFLGRKIEESLMRFQFLIEPRYGPFRCVGPVLEQTGITSRSIPQFAEILQECRNESWSDILSIGYKQFIHKVEAVRGGTYLSLFLKSDNNGVKSGWEFTRSVARSLSQYEADRISWAVLQALPGYRPGFWKELRAHTNLVAVNPGKTQRRSAPLPRLVFDPLLAQVQIRFDHDFVERRVYTLERDVIQCSVWPLTERADFKRRYDGLLCLDGIESRNWQIPGWSMDSTELVAIFHPQRGYIPHDVPVPSGQCFLLAPTGTPTPSLIKVLTDFEFVSISDAAYQYWQIEVSSDTDLSPFGYTQRQAGVGVISWADDGERFPASIESGDVFLGQLPPLRLNDAGLFRQNRLALFVESGSNTQRVEVSGETDSVEIALPIVPPAAGLAIVEPLGRRRLGDSAYAGSKLEFTVLPNFPCCWPTGLHSPNSHPVIAISAPLPLSIEFPECEQIEPGIWAIPKGISFVEGILHMPARSIRLAWTIYRAAFMREKAAEQRCFDTRDFDADFLIRLAGLPSMPIWLGLGNTKVITSIGIPQTFDAAGHKYLSSFAFRDPFQRFTEPAGEILIWGNTSWVSTGVSLLNLSAMRNWLLSASQDELPQWFHFLDDSLRSWLEQMRNAIALKTTAPSFTPNHSLPSTVGVWAHEIWLMVMAFNGSDIPGIAAALGLMQPPQIDPEIHKTLRWICAARRIVEHGQLVDGSDGDHVVGDYQTLTWRPFRSDWARTMVDLFGRLRQFGDLNDMIVEWAQEAISPMRTILRSRIANQSAGRELTEAYVCARQGDYVNAYRMASLLQSRTESALVRDLAFLIKTIVRFNGNLPLEPPPPRMHQKLEPFIAGIFALFAAQKPCTVPQRVVRPSEALDPHILPLHQSEIALLRRAVGLPVA